MEIISTPFSIFVAALYLLYIFFPLIAWAYRGVQAWGRFLTDGRHSIKTPLDKFMSKIYWDDWEPLA